VNFRAVRISAIVAVAASVMPTGAGAKERSPLRPARPVFVSTGQCIQGSVQGLSKKAKVSVRSSPSAKAKELDRLPNNFYVYACERVATGGVEWIGLVYSRLGHGEECGVGIEAPSKKKGYSYTPDTGPCWSGWITPEFFLKVDG
jgi:hypothetical protein